MDPRFSIYATGDGRRTLLSLTRRMLVKEMEDPRSLAHQLQRERG